MFSPKNKNKNTNIPRSIARIPRSEQTQSCKYQTNLDTHSWALILFLLHVTATTGDVHIFYIQTPSSTETHKPRKIIKPTWKIKTHKFKTNNTQMEKQTQIEPLVTNAVEQRTLKERPCQFSMMRSSRFGHRGFADL